MVSNRENSSIRSFNLQHQITNQPAEKKDKPEEISYVFWVPPQKPETFAFKAKKLADSNVIIRNIAKEINFFISNNLACRFLSLLLINIPRAILNSFTKKAKDVYFRQHQELLQRLAEHEVIKDEELLRLQNLLGESNYENKLAY